MSMRLPRSSCRLFVALWGTVLHSACASPEGAISGSSSSPEAQAEAAPTAFWNERHAHITPTGDLEWSPREYHFEAGSSPRYIDYLEGDDGRDGKSPETAWKHHPWDPAAQGNAAVEEGSHTYVFRGGVTYRGRLIADESGTKDQPIRLARDPAWGEGPASLAASEAFSGGWTRADASNAPGIPHPEKVWYRDLPSDFPIPRMVWEQRNTEILRIHLARSPNWIRDDLDDVRAGWWSWESVGIAAPPESSTEMNRAADPENLAKTEMDLTGATVWSEWIAVMGTPYAARIEHHDRDEGALYFTGFFEDSNRMEPNNRYFVEDHPGLLDAPGEFFYDADGPFPGRLYLRLPEDRDPNETQIEVGRYLNTIDLRGHSHIAIENLHFRFSDIYDPKVRPRRDPEVHSAAVRSYGASVGITVSHCDFAHLGQAIFLKAYGDGDHLTDIRISDNRISETDHGAINVENSAYFFRTAPGGGTLGHVSILRNKLTEIGFRPERKYHGHALTVLFPETGEIAGNILERIAGAGIFAYGGKGSRLFGTRPFSRLLIHQNKVIDPLLQTNDWGGIEVWQGGPTYVFNNISGNPGGYWHWKHLATLEEEATRDHTSARFGFAYYLDGAFKTYVFNNVAWGKSSTLDSPLLNSAAFQGIHGFLNQYFNNTSFRFAAGMRRQAPVAGRELYLGNLWMDISEIFFWHAKPRDEEADANAEHVGAQEDHISYETLGYAGNVFDATPRTFAVFEGNGRRHRSLEAFSDALEARAPLTSSVGVMTEESPVRDAVAHDFRLTANSAAIDQGHRVFVPWALSNVVGEWHFHASPSQPERIFDEHWKMDETAYSRDHYHDLPRYDLEVASATLDDYIDGTLEDWTRSALRFDGSRFARLPNDSLIEDVPVRIGPKNYRWPGVRRETVDMAENSFILEIVFRADPGHTNGLLVEKAGSSGYRLSIDAAGKPVLEILYGDSVVAARTGTHAVNDGDWHHLLVEVERDEIVPDNRPIRIFLDGEEATGAWNGLMPTKYVQLSNRSDFFVGGAPDKTGLQGAIDFLRVSRGTLEDAYTSYEELYSWQFDGPQFRDFRGIAPNGSGRDAGAFEFVPAEAAP